jgi:2-haloacid dehalogenase
MLEQLTGRGYRLAILSNGTPDMLRSAVERTGIAALLEAVFSVEQVGVFKPDPQVYRLACDGLGIVPDQIAFVSSNSWDAHAASAFGMRVVWCNRSGQIPENLPGKPDSVLSSLQELPSCVSMEA